MAMSPKNLSSSCQLKTPPAEVPEDRDQWRFRSVYDALEWIEEYRPGGYHPVELGDVFNGKYKVMRKLGYGSYSTVWLARDVSGERYLSLKILKASVDHPRELDILSHLAGQDTAHAGSSHVLRLLDHFQHVGPNGTHLCFVTEVLGPSVSELLEPPWRNIRDSTQYPRRVAREISRQALLGLAYIHKAGIVHGDIYGGNLLFEIPGLDAATEDNILSDLREPVETDLIQRKDGSCPEGGDPWAPRKLLLPQPLWGTNDAPRVDITAPVIKFVDFGGAFKSGAQIAPLPETPYPFRAPERILELGTWDRAIDIWGLGCLIFSLITNQLLVQLDGFGGDQTINDDHLLRLHDIIGPLPEFITRKWDRYSLYFDAEGHQNRNTPVDYEIDFDKDRKPLRQHLRERCPGGMSDAEAEDLHSVLSKMLRYDPAQRLSAEELLKEPWFDLERN